MFFEAVVALPCIINESNIKIVRASRPTDPKRLRISITLAIEASPYNNKQASLIGYDSS